MREELKKYYIHCKWLWIIAGFVLLKVILVFFSPYREDDVISRNKTQYFEYLSEYGGHLTHEKEQRILTEFDSINAAKSEKRNITNQFLKGRISDIEYSDQINELNKITDREDAFMKIFAQYEYVSANPDRREILYSSGWEILLAAESPDLLLAALIVLLISQLFAREYETGMSQILLPTKNGRMSLCSKKLSVCLITTSSSTLLFMFIQIMFAAVIGLDNCHAGLESLEIFYNTPREINLLTALVFLCSVKLFGYCFFAVLVLLISAIAKRLLPTMCISFALIVIQYAAFGSTDFKYRFAVPYGFMLGKGYLMGEKKGAGDDFVPISDSELILIFIISAIIFAMLILCVLNSFSFGKFLGKLFALLSCVILLAGCQNKAEYQDFRLNGSEYTENTDYIFSYIGNGMIINKSTGKTTDFIRDPFYDIEIDEDKAPITAPIFTEGNNAYFLYDNGTSIIIKRRNLIDMSDEIIYQSINEERKYFLGLGHSYARTHSYVISGFFLNEKYIFFVTNSGIISLSRFTGVMEEIITEQSLTNITFDGKNIYYISSEYILNRYDTETAQTERVISDRVFDFIFVKNSLYYSSISDGKRLYVCNTDGSGGKRITDDPVKSLTTNGEYIYYISTDDLCGSVYRISIDNLDCELFYEYDAYFVYAFTGFDKVIAYVHNETSEMTSLYLNK